MDIPFYKSSGLSLTIGSFLAISTMVLHPAGGSLEHLIQITTPLKFTHGLALCCLPFILFGFYGLSHRLLDFWKMSYLALVIISFGLFAAMLAALLNGLALPFFLESYAGNMEQERSIVVATLNYGFAINKALDFVFIVSLCCALGIYSIHVIRSKRLSIGLGYLGMAILLFAVLGSLTNFTFTNLMGFRVFVFSVALWMAYAGIALLTSN